MVTASVEVNELLPYAAGSNAIAGVINIVLKDRTNKVSGFVHYAAYSTNAKEGFFAGTPNKNACRLDTEKDGNAIARAFCQEPGLP